MERPSSSAQNKFREAVKMNVVEPAGGRNSEIVQVDIDVGRISDHSLKPDTLKRLTGLLRQGAR